MSQLIFTLYFYVQYKVKVIYLWRRYFFSSKQQSLIYNVFTPHIIFASRSDTDLVRISRDSNLR